VNFFISKASHNLNLRIYFPNFKTFTIILNFLHTLQTINKYMNNRKKKQHVFP